MQQLDSSTFDDFLSRHKVVLVAIVHQLSPRCQRLLNVLAEVAATQITREVQIAVVDCVESQDISRRYSVAPPPALILHRNGQEIHRYKGVYRDSELQRYLLRSICPLVTPLTADNLNDFKHTHEVACVATVRSLDQSEELAIQNLARSLYAQCAFGIILTDELVHKDKIKQSCITVYKHGTEYSIVDLSDDTSAMQRHVGDAVRPLVVDIMPEVHDDYLDSFEVIGYIFVKDSSRSDAMRQMFESLAQRYRPQLLLGIVDVSVDDSLVYDMRVNDAVHPTFATREAFTNAKYPMRVGTGAFEDMVSSHCELFLQGQLRPDIRSLPVPECQSALVDVVALNYEEIIMDNNRDVFVEFYTDWCGPCKTVLPVLQDLALRYAADDTTKDKITIATIDAEGNDLPGWDRDVRGFPWFKLYPAGNKQAALIYSGEPRVSSIASFIRVHGSHHAELAQILS